MESNIYIYILFFSCLRSEVLQFIRLIPDEVFLTPWLFISSSSRKLSCLIPRAIKTTKGKTPPEMVAKTVGKTALSHHHLGGWVPLKRWKDLWNQWGRSPFLFFNRKYIYKWWIQLYAIMATGETWPLSFVGDESWAWWYSSEAWGVGEEW